MPTSILSAYGLPPDQCEIRPFGNGLINNTWKVIFGNKEYILQRINHNVFTNPSAIAENLQIIGDYLKIHSPEYLFVTPEHTTENEALVFRENKGYFRLLPFIKNSYTFDVVDSPGIAYEAARQFGCFTKKLSGLDAGILKTTLPDFHNLTLRYKQFETSLEKGNPERITEAASAIAFLKSQQHLVKTFEKIKADSGFKRRVTHHDTKISNVLFDRIGHGLCVIDLDTTMPGYFISDVGDMMRTYLSPFSEEEKDFSKISIREEYFMAIAKGYLEEMKEELTTRETDYFVYAGEFMIYMQAVRFLTDYINDDVYYGSKYKGHNFVRAQNQIVLLERFQEKGKLFKKQVLQLAG